MTTTAKAIRHAVEDELQALVIDGTWTQLQSYRTRRVTQSDLPLGRLNRSDEQINIDQLGEAEHLLELRITHVDFDDDGVDDRIDEAAEKILTTLSDSTVLHSLITQLTPVGVELTDGDDENPIVQATVRIQVNYERGL